MLSHLKCANMCHPLVSSVRDYVRIQFKPIDTQQPIVVRWLVFCRNAKPLVIWIERTGQVKALIPDEHQ